MKNFRLTFLFTVLLTLIGFFTLRDINDPYSRSINGDGKGYYAYLPAIFIYHDLDYGFTDEMEKAYYPADGSHAKQFKNKQRNGSYVNKYFPGISLLYLPFFLLSAGFAWLSGFPVDGYSLPFQLGIGLAHLFYYFCGLWLLFKIARSFLNNSTRYLYWMLILTPGTNCWYYLVYDHTVTHIFLFFLSCVFCWSWHQFAQTGAVKWLGRSLLLLGLIIIIRPTGLMIAGFIPFLLFMENRSFNWLKEQVSIHKKRLIMYGLGALMIVAIAPLLWFLQSGLWLVYSYNEEGFNFAHPNTWNYLFSYEKGWLVWTPALALTLVLAAIGLKKHSWKAVLLFFIPLALVIYVLSSWWCWTYGMGIGQRTMIEYYPFLFLGVLFFLRTARPAWNLLFIPLIGLNLIQNYQVFQGIYDGGTTTKNDYWSHFLQLKTDPPTVEIPANWQKIATFSTKTPGIINTATPFSEAVLSDSISGPAHIVLHLTIGGTTKDNAISLVLSNEPGTYYQANYPGNFLYSEPRELQYVFDVNPEKAERFKAYVWNGDTESEAEVTLLKMDVFQLKSSSVR